MRPALLLLLFSCATLLATDPDPATLKPTSEQTVKAELLAARLGSDQFSEREIGSRELATMGRSALAVVEKTLATTDDAEVRSRCEALLPAMQQEDLKARLDTFNADADGKYDHKLPAWSQFKETTGATPAARTLFATMYQHEATARVLAASGGNKDDFQALVVARRTEIYNRIYGRVMAPNGVVVASRERTLPTVPEVAGQLFAEGVIGTSSNRNYSFALNTMLQQPAVKEAITDEVKGAPLRKLFAHWCDTRTDAVEVYSAMNTATMLALKDVPATKYALKLLEIKTATQFYRAYAITALAKAGGKEQLPNLLKQFDDKTVLNAAFVNAQGQVERLELQLRDIALAMAVTVTDQKLTDYGFEVRSALEANKYTYNNVRLPTDEKRAEAFKKWDEWQKLNPVKK